jgi:DNA repair protein RadC
VVLHNHPSGDPAPSAADIRITRSLREAAALLQINLIDHIILGSPDGGRVPYYSFKEAGHL